MRTAVCYYSRPHGNTRKGLEAAGMVQREGYPQIPPKVEYSLAERGRSRIPMLDAMCVWGEENRPGGKGA